MWGGGSTLVIISILFWFFWFFPRGTSCVVNSKPERRHIVRCCAFCFNHWKQFPVIFVLNSVKLTRIRAHCSCYRVCFFFCLAGIPFHANEPFLTPPTGTARCNYLFRHNYKLQSAHMSGKRMGCIFIGGGRTSSTSHWMTLWGPELQKLCEYKKQKQKWPNSWITWELIWSKSHEGVMSHHRLY